MARTRSTLIIELSWDESAKETDVIYLIARNTSGK